MRLGRGLGMLVALGLAATACGDDGGGTGGSGGSTSSSGGGGAGGEATGGGGMAATGGGGAGGAESGPMACLGNVEWPALEKDMQLAQLHFHDSFAGAPEPIDGLHVKACARDDLLCESPIDEADTGLDEQGQPEAGDPARLLLPVTNGVGWDGYFEVTGPGIPTNLFVTHRPYTDDPNIDFGVITTDVVDIMLGLYGKTEAGPSHGHIAIAVKDCFDQNAAGAQVSLDGGDELTDLRYFVGDGAGAVPSASATETNESGQLAIADVPADDGSGASVVTATATVAATGAWIGDVDIVVRPGAVTSLGLNPEPTP